MPLDQITDAEHAVREAAAGIPAEVSAGFETTAALSAEDRRTITEIARRALARFYPKPEAKPEVKAGPKLAPEPKPKVSTETRPKPVAVPVEKSCVSTLD